MTGGASASQGGGEEVREQDRYLPIANISRIMKKSLVRCRLMGVGAICVGRWGVGWNRVVRTYVCTHTNPPTPTHVRDTQPANAKIAKDAKGQ